MNRAALILALGISGLVGAKLSPDIYAAPAVADVQDVGVNPNGVCPATDAGVPSIAGGTPGTCFETLATIRIPSKRAAVPALEHHHRSTTNPDAEAALTTLIAQVVLPTLAAMEPVHSNPDLWDAPTLADCEVISVQRPAGPEPRLYLRATARAKREGVPDFVLTKSIEPPAPALSALLPLLTGYVLPAVAAEVFP